MSEFLELDKLVESCDYDTKLAVTAWVMKHIMDHAREGGSYRYLIYDRLDFGMDAYGVLLHDGMEISNEFDLEKMNNIKKIVIENKLELLKKELLLCDEPGCFNNVCVWWPSENGNRSTCSEHWSKEK